MYKIEKVTISKMWGEKSFYLDFDKKLNFLIGQNGSGKTTFLNILTAALSLKLDILSNIDFEKIEISLLEEKKKKKVTIIKKYIEKSRDFDLIYKFSNKKYTIERIGKYSEEYYLRRHRLVRISEDNFKKIKENLNNLVDLNIINVTRFSSDSEEDLYDFINTARRKGYLADSINLKLKKLLEELQTYKLRLEATSGEISKQFQKIIFDMLIYDGKLDEKNYSKNEINNETKKRLENLYQELGFSKKEIDNKVIKHIHQMQKIINKESSKEEIINKALFSRTLKLLAEVDKVRRQKEELMKPVTEFQKITNNFLYAKNINIDSTGKLIIKMNSGKIIPFTTLSSGEKQLLILFIQILLQENKKTIFIADEPEISLHIGWQRFLVDALVSFNKNAQIILATHSPDIVGSKKDYIIQMEGVL